MNRRGFLRLLAAVGVSVGLKPAPPTRYGPMPLNRYLALKAQGLHLRVIHQGQDVSNRCRFADDTGEGMADLHLHNAQGKPYLRPMPGDAPAAPWERQLATETVYGVTFQKVAAF